MTLDQLLGFCLAYFKALDESNAVIHCAQVRYSPITFRLAEKVREVRGPGFISDDAAAVLSHVGAYPEDPGR